MTLTVVGWLLDADSPHQRAIVGGWSPSMGGMTAEPLVLRVDAEVEIQRLRQDAERYRWLRTQHWSTGPLAVAARPKDAIKLGHDAPSQSRLDDAVDIAMAESAAAVAAAQAAQ